MHYECEHETIQLQRRQFRMPPKARARGFWNGPEPEAFRTVTYKERRVLRLARVYQAVKRLSPGVVPYAHGNVADLPE